MVWLLWHWDHSKLFKCIYLFKSIYWIPITWQVHILNKKDKWLLVNVYQKGWRCWAGQFLWCKVSHHGRLQATSVNLLQEDLRRDMHTWFLRSATDRLQHPSMQAHHFAHKVHKDPCFQGVRDMRDYRQQTVNKIGW